MSDKNPLKWPSFEQLGRDLWEGLSPALAQLLAGETELDSKATNSLERVLTWLEAPCVASVKLDGTNLGIDENGLIVGRNTVVPEGQSYSKVDVWKLLGDHKAKAAAVKASLQAASADEGIAHMMLYGELVINSKYDYVKAGLFKDWLCFGVLLRPAAEASDEKAPARLSSQLRSAGYFASAMEGNVLLALNQQLHELLTGAGVRTVVDGYAPMEGWAEHGHVPQFDSLRALVTSDWAQRLLLPGDGQPLAEGIVVASEAGHLFKWKHGGEELGKVPQQMEEAVNGLRSLPASATLAQCLPHGSSTASATPPEPDSSSTLAECLLPVFEILLRIATTVPAAPAAKATAKAGAKSKEKSEDREAMAVFESAETKFDLLEEVFARGAEAMKVMEKEMIEQVTLDLVKDYDAEAKEAQVRAFKVVKRLVGMRYGAWKASQS